MRGGGLMLEIGKIYRYASSATVDGVIPEIVDSLPNFFYETRNDIGATSIKFQKGIHPIATVTLENGEKRRAV